MQIIIRLTFLCDCIVLVYNCKQKTKLNENLLKDKLTRYKTVAINDVFSDVVF